MICAQALHRPMLLALLCTLFLTGVARGEPPVTDNSSPERIADQALIALKENRVSDFAALMHPEAMKQLKTTLLSVADAAGEKDEADEFLRLFSGVKTLDELRKLDDAAFFTAFLSGVIQMMPQFKETLRAMTTEVIGHVAEGEDIVHVVYRGTVSQGEVTIRKMAVMSLKRNGPGWGMLLTGDIEGMTSAFKRQFGARD